MAALLFLGDKKRAFPEAFKKGLAYLIFPIVVGFASYTGFQQQTPPSSWTKYHLDQQKIISYAAVRSFVVSTGCSLCSFIILRVFLPLSFFTPHAVAMRSMGLLEASVHKDGMRKRLQKYMSYHDATKAV